MVYMFPIAGQTAGPNGLIFLAHSCVAWTLLLVFNKSRNNCTKIVFSINNIIAKTDKNAKAKIVQSQGSHYKYVKKC